MTINDDLIDKSRYLIRCRFLKTSCALLPLLVTEIGLGGDNERQESADTSKFKKCSPTALRSILLEASCFTCRFRPQPLSPAIR